MERLTKRIESFVYYTQGKYTDTIPAEMTKADIRNVLSKLAEYEDAEEQGLLIRLPCKVWDTLYEASRQWKTVITRTVAAIVIYNNNIWIRNGCGDTFEYGVEVFLTKEEAEAALERMGRR